MAPFLSRLISIQKIFSSSVRSEDLSNESKRIKPPKFDSSKQVRVLLFRELNGQDRKLLYDSKSVRKKDPSAAPADASRKKPPLPRHYQESSIEKSFKLNDNQSKEFVYEWQKPSPDEQMLREMIFGSVSISYQGSTLKVHSIRSPSQIMLSVVFAAPPMPMFRIGDREPDESGNWTAPGSEVDINKPQKADCQLAHSVPVNVPRRFFDFGEANDSDTDSLQSHDGYSSLPTSQLLTPDSASTCLPRSSSYNSLQRRLLRNKATSIELGLKKQDEMLNEYARGPGQKRVKLGLSVVISLDEEDKNEEKQFSQFLFTHMSLIEGHLMNLKAMVIRAYLNRRNFVQLMFEGATRFQQAIEVLYTSPRLQNPEWLTIISSSNHRHLSYSFLRKFAHLLKEYDKKETNFFVSTLLSAVLANHLSWVPSVIPTDAKVRSTQSSHKHTPYWVEFLAKSRPYNPHWVQLSDLYGALGSTLKLSKTIVKGQNGDVIFKFLQVLSYFIRCSDICEKFYEGIDKHTLETELQFESDGFNSEKSQNSDKLSSTPTSSITQDCNIQCLLNPNSYSTVPSDAKISDSESTSDCSKDLCEISITPTEDCIPSSFESKTPTSPSELENVSICEQCHSLSEKQSDFQGLSDVAASSAERTSDGVVSLTSEEKTAESDQAECNYGTFPCYDKPSSHDTNFAREPVVTETKECESLEEGYHSMEEPHSPSKSKMQLSEMLKRYDDWCPEGLKEVPFSELQAIKTEDTVSLFFKSFGWSLMAGVSNKYRTDFCLQGVTGPLNEDTIREDLIRSTHMNVLGEQVAEAVCIVADTDAWNVQLLSSNYIGTESLGLRIGMSSLISEMCDSILNMYELGISPESCIIYLEDRLQELYFRSLMFSDYMRGNQSAVPLSKVSSTLNMDISDMPLLLSIATTHTACLQ